MASNGKPSRKSSDRPLARAEGLHLRFDTPKGRGVFTSNFITKGTIIDVSPVLIFTQDEVENHTSETCLQHYTYYWPSTKGNTSTQAIALGLGSMFNHSRAKQNVGWKRDVEDQCITYIALCDIEAGQELCISYGNERLWFKDADAADGDDEWTKIRAQKDAMQELAEIEISGIGNIEL